MILGAIIAGGTSSRFGSDKGAAMLAGRPLLDYAAAVLRPHVDCVAIVGRNWRDLPRIEDRPTPGLGPMGGIAGALGWAETRGFDVVLSIGCDTPTVPGALLLALLADPPAWCGDNPVIGAWPSALATAALTYAANDPRRSIRGWCEAIQAQPVPSPGLANLNTPADLTALERP